VEIPFSFIVQYHGALGQSAECFHFSVYLRKKQRCISSDKNAKNILESGIAALD
jgi:hypothetical protein